MAAEENPDKTIVLVVDDEATILRSASAALAGIGLRVIVAENGHAGWEAFTKFQDEICLVLADIVMPVMNGLELAERIREMRPEMKLLLMSGYSDKALEIEGRLNFAFIRKPFLPADLIRRISGMLGRTAG
jgi:two-component system cell cycle sensor histidine kinase/response regulator CckA